MTTKKLNPQGTTTPGSAVTGTLLVCGAAGAPLFVIVLLVEGALRAHYNPLYHSGSHLSLGDRGWIQATAFVVTGLLMIAYAVGVRRALRSLPTAVLIAVFGAGLVVSGLFPMDPMQGYPPGAPQGIPAGTSWRHAVHDVAALPVFLGLTAACLAAAVRLRGWWRAYSAVTGVAVLALFAGYGQAFASDAPNAGLIQRVLIVTGWTWLTLLAVHLIRRSDGSPAL
ncbi:DUF998 domain-containing protein [Nonomuraea sp. NPDC046802]|uniref:DUF998 domain-containing protein n=1 Tax=Nonomuraea sp. NPDC046802 TaxID=3154919 RepID=UPI0033E99BBD